jgi:beta-phosphoglucomutase
VDGITTKERIAVPFGVNLLAAAAFAVISLIVSTAFHLRWWTSIVVLGAVLFALTLFALPGLQRRILALRVLKEVSSSRCGDLFLQYAALICEGDSSWSQAKEPLQALCNARKYPNQRFLRDLTSQCDGSSTEPGVVIQEITLAKQQVRAATVKALSDYLRTVDVRDQIVLYGYSSVICDAIAQSARSLPSTVFIIEDLQYGVDGSFNEHLLAMTHLEGAGLHPKLVKFEQIAALRSRSSDFIHDSTGSSIPLVQNRNLIVLLGCEAITRDGHILIPSRVRGQPSETAKFVEVFRQTGEHIGSEVEVPTSIAIVGESFKLIEGISKDSIDAHAPVKEAMPRQVGYLMGLRRMPKGQKIELVKLAPLDIDWIIDDLGHHSTHEILDLDASLRHWRTMISDSRGSRGALETVSACRAVIFDLNGVLLDDESVHFQAFVDLVHDFKCSLSYDEYLRFCSGRTDREGLQQLIWHKQLAEPIQSLLRRKREAYDRHFGSMESHIYSEAPTYVRELDVHGRKCYLVTSSDEVAVGVFLAAAELQPQFPSSRRFTEVDAAIRTDVYRTIISDAKLSPRQIVLFDDSPTNLREAGEIGLRTIGVTTTHNREQIEASCDVAIESLNSLTAVRGISDGS